LRKAAATAITETLVAGGLWGTSFPVISVAIKDGLDPVVFVFLRFVIATPLMFIVATLVKREVRTLVKNRAVWIVAFLNAVGFLCQFVGQKYTGAAVAALLVNLSVVFAAIGGTIFLREALGPLKLAGVILALAGTLLLATGGNISQLNVGQAVGDVLYLVSAISWAGYIVFAKRKTDEERWDPVGVSTIIVALTCVFLSPALFFANLTLPGTVGSWEAVAYTAVLNTAVPFVLYQAGLRYLTAVSSAVVLMVQIVVALVISVTLLGETFTTLSLAGGLSILASILLVSGVEVGGKSLSVGQNGRTPVQV
jgi:drug/metabolite transporter (DMT)-like permease